MTEAAFLHWIADRLVYIHGESESADYILRLRQLADLAVLDGDRDLPPFVTPTLTGGPM